MKQSADPALFHANPSADGELSVSYQGWDATKTVLDGQQFVVTWGQGQVEARIVERRRSQSSYWSTKTVRCAVVGWGSLVSCLRNCGAPESTRRRKHVLPPNSMTQMAAHAFGAFF